MNHSKGWIKFPAFFIPNADGSLKYQLRKGEILAIANSMSNRENANRLIEIYDSTLEAQRALYKKISLEQVSLNFART